MAIRNIALSFVTALFLVFAAGAAAQTAKAAQGPAELYELVLKDGSRMYGTVERETDQEVGFRTQAGAT
ncbi:MAG: hypothetical protein H0W08_10120, partial [Acidobacteria bacterium]|nr:hypothetical protein [Acidobacteriota bacterium]